MNEDFTAFKDALENLNSRKSTSRRILLILYQDNAIVVTKSSPENFRRHKDNKSSGIFS